MDIEYQTEAHHGYSTEFPWQLTGVISFSQAHDHCSHRSPPADISSGPDTCCRHMGEFASLVGELKYFWDRPANNGPA
ncbi:hypothetical protein PAAG_11644 [Paracoccidioides lutzii Pb01]|uniref:Uncharacterized protein n=1 Tax=Paracoccidioides lutzii (strain ATCC MYA-826 / Pb01) TaxID=502779 RepID=A0A0A2V2G9_PARBA|nr:hypothetical protein PAAG_11644 [Paracoccidioides lutzii Pb01]KGQ01653.1 hypothetical protein PAAG_11644 [Paracoccidioides lutzii Pb01]